MNIKPSLHNVIMIVAIAVLGILLIRLASKSPAGRVPVLGSVLKTGAAA